MSPVTVFFAAAQAGEAICGAVEYLAPGIAAVAAWHGIRRAIRWARRLPARLDQHRFHRRPAPDFNETEQTVNDLWTCRRIHLATAMAERERNTGTLNPRKEQQ